MKVLGAKKSMGLGLLWFLLFHGGLLLCVTAQTPVTIFTVKEKEVERMCHKQPLLIVNEEFPGPTITVNRGDVRYVKVENQSPYPITIHWHGLKQHRNPWSDGPEYITQGPIVPGASFTYDLRFSDEEGTIWWHAHSDWSRATVHGAIVVLPPPDRTEPKYPFSPQPDFSETIILGSWFRAQNVSEMYEQVEIFGGDAPGPDSFLINGRPGIIYECSAPTLDMYTLDVEHEKNYLLRIINAVMDEEMFFAIAGHTFKVVAIDGSYLNPITTDHIMITPGQTMDILLYTNQDKTKAYYMGAKDYQESSFGAGQNLITKALLRYPDHSGDMGDPVDLGSLLPSTPINVSYAKAFTDKLLVAGLTDNPNFPMNVPADADINKNYRITISTNSLPCPRPENDCNGPPYSSNVTGVHSASLNNQRFVTNQISILQAYHCKIPNVYTEDFPMEPADFDYTGDVGENEHHPNPGTKVMAVNYGDAVEIVFQGTNVGNAENHPMHVHGYNFYLVGSGSGNFDESKRSGYNLKTPPQVNTFGVPMNGWIALRFWARNPGVWFMHCHLERHASWGMAAVLIVKEGTEPEQTLLPPPGDYPPCP